MAGNSVPFFFGAKARTKKPPGLDVTSITDISASMGDFASFITARSTFIALENELVNQGIGVVSTNQYSFTTGGGGLSAGDFDTLSEIEKPVKVNGVETRWATGAQILNSTAVLPTLIANLTNKTEDMGLATNLVVNNNRDYIQANRLVIISGSDEQQGGSFDTAYDTTPVYPYIYVGVHNVSLTIGSPGGPNPAPAGTLVGFVYTTNTTGTGIYINGNTISYRVDVPVSSVTATAQGGTRQLNVNQALATNGAIYNIEAFRNASVASFDQLGTSLGNVLGKFLFETS